MFQRGPIEEKNTDGTSWVWKTMLLTIFLFGVPTQVLQHKVHAVANIYMKFLINKTLQREIVN